MNERKIHQRIYFVAGTLIGLLLSLPLWIGFAWLIAKLINEVGWVTWR